MLQNKKFKVVQKDIDLPLKQQAEFYRSPLSGVNSKTKVIFISQVTSQTALIFPVKEICEYAKRSGIVTIIDGAHVPFYIKLDIKDLDAIILVHVIMALRSKGSIVFICKRKFAKKYDSTNSGAERRGKGSWTITVFNELSVAGDTGYECISIYTCSNKICKK